MDEQALSNEEFYRELANRFFNDKSYFCHCIKNELDGVMYDVQSASKPEYMLLGNLIDHLFSVDEPLAELDNINGTGAFQEFNERLRQGITFLQETDLDSERMMIEIESLAHSLLNSLVLAFQDKAAVRHLESILDSRGQEDALPDLELSSQRTALESPAVPESEVEFGLSDSTLDVGLEWQDDELLESEQTAGEAFSFDDLLTPESPSDDSAAASTGSQDQEHVAIPEAEPLDLSDALVGAEGAPAVELIPSEESDEMQPPGDLDVEPDTQLVSGEAQENSETGEPAAVRDSREDLGAQKHEPAPPGSHEPDVVIRYFIEETREHLASLEEVVQVLQNSPDSAEAWKREDAILESLVMTAVIYGFEAFEQIAGKARKMIAETLKGSDRENGRALVMLVKARQMLLKFTSDDPETVDGSLVKDFTSRLQTPKLTPRQEPEPEQDPEQGDELEEAQEHGDETDSSSARTAQEAPALEQRPLKLPGEDDQEVISLIAEISGEEVSPAVHSNETMDGNQDSTEHNEFSETVPAVHGSPDFETIKNETVVTVYHRGAELYYSVIAEALDALENHKGSKTALDDLELAANALYGLALKLNLEQFGRFPDLILNLTKDAVATNYSFDTSELECVKRAFHCFRNMKDADDVLSYQFQQLLASLLELSSSIKIGAMSQGEGAVPSPEMPT